MPLRLFGLSWCGKSVLVIAHAQIIIARVCAYVGKGQVAFIEKGGHFLRLPLYFFAPILSDARPSVHSFGISRSPP